MSENKDVIDLNESNDLVNSNYENEGNENEGNANDNLIIELSNRLKQLEQEQQKRERDLENEISLLRDEVRKGGSVSSESGYVFGDTTVPKKIDPKDQLKIPITYITIGRGFNLSAYNRNGSEVVAPYNRPVFFKWRNSDVIKTSNGDKPIHYSLFTAWSQKEVDFIEGSPYFNLTIFDSVKKASSVDPSVLANIEKASNWISSMTDDQLFAHAAQYGIEINNGNDYIRKTLIAIRLQEIMDSDERVYRGNAALEHLREAE